MIMLNARVMCVKDTKYVQRNIPAGTFPPHSIAGLSTAVGKQVYEEDTTNSGFNHSSRIAVDMCQ